MNRSLRIFGGSGLLVSGFKRCADQHTALRVQVLGLLALQLCTGKILESAASTRTL